MASSPLSIVVNAVDGASRPARSRRAATTVELDRMVLELIQARGACGVSELATATELTATAIRVRLGRFIRDGFVERVAETALDGGKSPRGRPTIRYRLCKHPPSDSAVQGRSDNYAALSLALWDELRSIRDVEIRTGMLKRLAGRLAAIFSPSVRGNTPGERMASVAALFAQMNLRFSTAAELPNSGDSTIAATNETPVTEISSLNVLQPEKNVSHPALIALACPYPELAEKDRSICKVEHLVLSELVGTRVELSSCRLDGHSCCRFQST